VPEERFEERRRFPRLSVDANHEMRTSRHVRVRLLDVSASGALLETGDRLAVGTKGRLRLVLGGATFESAVEVTRQGPSADGRARVAAVAMVAAPSIQQGVLDDFLKRAGN